MIYVFISYKSTDLAVAKGVKSKIEQHDDFKAYLDRVDDTLLKNDPDLADRLRERIDECDQLLAVVGPETRLSWWVPWEIGVGSEKNYFLSTYCRRSVTLPSYLKRWPVLRSDSDIDQYCDLSRRHRRDRDRRIVAARTVHLSEQGVRQTTAAAFHNDLRHALGQT